jgi:hypothetical protein
MHSPRLLDPFVIAIRRDASHRTLPGNDDANQVGDGPEVQPHRCLAASDPKAILDPAAAMNPKTRIHGRDPSWEVVSPREAVAIKANSSADVALFHGGPGVAARGAASGQGT